MAPAQINKPTSAEAAGMDACGDRSAASRISLFRLLEDGSQTRQLLQTDERYRGACILSPTHASVIWRAKGYWAAIGESGVARGDPPVSDGRDDC